MGIMAGTSLRGSLLVATPGLLDPNFARTVVLLLEHGAEGALGVVLNRPSDTPLAVALPAWGDAATEPAVVYAGGPVATTSAVCLARRRLDAEPPGWQPVFGPVGAFDVEADPALVAATVAGLRVFAGYAGWGAEQLEAEIAEDAWMVVEALPDDAFSVRPERLWRSVLRRQPGEVSLLATYPTDPRLN